MSKCLLVFCLFIFFIINAYSNPFLPERKINIPVVINAISVPNDFNGDQKTDLFISGFDGQVFTHRVYNNKNGDFTSDNYTSVDIQGQCLSANAIDYNVDGLYDLLITNSYNGKAYIGLYENRNGAFQKKPSVLDYYVYDSIIAYPLNFNQDIFTDIMMLGRNGNQSWVVLFENKNGLNFFENKISLSNNPDLNFSMTRSSKNGQPLFLWMEKSSGVAAIYEISPIGILIRQARPLPKMLGQTQWVDIDADQDQDIYLNGTLDGVRYHGFLMNENNSFVRPAYQLPILSPSKTIFHDFNLDGYYDLALSGVYPSDSSLVKIYDNTQGGWNVGKTIAITKNTTLSVSDFDKDGQTDLMIMGITNGKYSIGVFSNSLKSNPLIFNSTLGTRVADNYATITWDKASSKTNPLIVGYNFRLFKDSILVKAFGDASHFSGNVIFNDSMTLRLSDGNYQIEIRAIDAAGNVVLTIPATFTIDNQNQISSPFEVITMPGLDTIGLTSKSRVVDINNDGKLDLLAVSNNGYCTSFIQNTANYFKPQGTFAGSDLMLSANQTNTFNTYYVKNEALFRYDASSQKHIFTGIDGVKSYVVLDIDNDGDDDVFVDQTREVKGVLYINVDGEFQKGKTDFVSYKDPWLVADVNKDGYSDIISKQGPTSLAVYNYSLGMNINGDSIHWTSFNKTSYNLQYLLDAEGDGDLDFWCRDYNGTYFIYQNNGGVFDSVANIGLKPTPEVASNKSILKICNMDGDIQKELFYFSLDTVYVFKSDVTPGVYSQPIKQKLYLPTAALSEINYIEAADFDHDRRLDILVQYKISEGKYQTIILYNKQGLGDAPVRPIVKTNEAQQTSIKLGWHPVENVDFYRVQLWTLDGTVINSGIKSLGASEFNTMPDVGNLYDTSLTLNNLPNNKYFWKVYTVKGSQVSPSSDTGSFTIDRYSAKSITSLNDPSRDSDFGGQQFSHPCDLDNDGDLDFLFLGTARDTIEGSVNFIGNNHMYINQGDGSFKTKRINIRDLYTNDVSFFDYNNDGYQDIALTAAGLLMANTHWETMPKFNYGVADFFTKIYINDKKNNFYDSQISLPALGLGNIDVADYNQDGKQDLLISGRAPINKMYDTPQWYCILATFNKDFTFTLDTLCKSIHTIYSQFQDTDADGDYDIFLLSKSINDNDITQLLVNRNGSYYENKVLNKQLSLIVGYDFNFFDFGDYDRDGDLDLVLLGTNVVKPSPTKSSYAYYAEYVGQALPVDWSFKIYTNLNNTFAPSGITIEAPLPKTRIHKLKWLDINNDGQLDIVVQQDNQIISILQKTNGDFKVTKEVEIFDAFSYSTFGDFNKDSKIDFVIGGRKTQFKCFYSNINNRNEAPAVPDRLKAVVVDDACVLSWEENGDDRTNKISLKYALELYKDNRLIFSNANFKDIPTEDYDNYFLSKKRAFNKLGDGLYHWRVASIDDNYQISNFSKPDTFRIALHPVISGRSTVCNYDTALYTVKPFHSNYSWEVIGGQILSKNNTGNELLVKWDKSGNNLVKITNTKYGIDTVFRVEVKYNPIPKIEYNFINNNTTNRTVQFRDSLPVSVSKYSWMFGDASNSIDSVATPIKTYPLAGSYNVTLKLDYTSLCSSTSTSKINLLDPVLIGPQNVCKGDAVEYTVEPAKFQYTWSIGNGMLLPQDSSSARATIVWNSVGSGSVVVRNTALNLMDSISIAINNVPTSKIFIPESLGTNAQIKFIDSVSSDVVRFDWDFGELNKTFSHSSPVVVFDQSGPHKITFTATNDKECKVTKSSNVTVTENLIPIEISNLITQNSDGFNDYLWIENIERFPENEVQLFTSWGKLVYKSTSYTNTFKPGSDGTEPLPSGSYFCIVTIGGSSKRFEQIITVF